MSEEVDQGVGMEYRQHLIHRGNHSRNVLKFRPCAIYEPPVRVLVAQGFDRWKSGDHVAQPAGTHKDKQRPPNQDAAQTKSNGHP